MTIIVEKDSMTKRARGNKSIIRKPQHSTEPKHHPIQETSEKWDFTEELAAALREVKNHMDGKIELQTAESFIHELKNSPV